MDTLHDRLVALFELILREVQDSPKFAEKLESALAGGNLPTSRRLKRSRKAAPGKEMTRSRNRRTAAVIDPFEIFSSGEDHLRAALVRLELEQLKDIVAQYGMDRSRLALKWKAPERLIDLITDTVRTRARKGDAFRSDLQVKESKTQEQAAARADEPAVSERGVATEPSD